MRLNRAAMLPESTEEDCRREKVRARIPLEGPEEVRLLDPAASGAKLLMANGEPQAFPKSSRVASSPVSGISGPIHSKRSRPLLLSLQLIIKSNDTAKHRDPDKGDCTRVGRKGTSGGGSSGRKTVDLYLFSVASFSTHASLLEAFQQYLV